MTWLGFAMLVFLFGFAFCLGSAGCQWIAVGLFFDCCFVALRLCYLITCALDCFKLFVGC